MARSLKGQDEISDGVAGKTVSAGRVGDGLSAREGQVHFQSTTSHKSLSLGTCEMGPSVAPLG